MHNNAQYKIQILAVTQYSSYLFKLWSVASLWPVFHPLGANEWRDGYRGYHDHMKSRFERSEKWDVFYSVSFVSS